MEDDDVAEFGGLWAPEAKNVYRLTLDKDDALVLGKCMIYSKETETAVIIEDGKLAVEVMQKMFDAGVPIVRWPPQI